MAGQIALGGFVALGAIMGGLVRYPRFANPAVGLGLLGLSAVVSIATIFYLA